MMKPDPASDLNDELRPEYDTAFIKNMMKNGVRGKYAGTKMSKDNTQNKMNEGDEMLDDYTGLLKNGVRGKFTSQTKHRIELSKRAQIWYDTMRETLETPENIGKLVVVDTDSGDYEIDDEKSSEAANQLRARHPAAALFALRIGYRTAVSFCGTLEPIKA